MGVCVSAAEPGEASGQLINCYALVTYVPGSLGHFLTDLRQELVAGCHLRSHVTYLPPRSLDARQETAWQRIHSVCDRWPAFEIDLTQVEVFPGTNVVYLALGRGRNLVEGLHQQLNSGPLYFDEPYQFHPHITLAQGIAPERFEATLQKARERWREYRGPRSFAVDEVVFVQATDCEDWTDLHTMSL